jgi:hypothetical protein
MNSLSCRWNHCTPVAVCTLFYPKPWILSLFLRRRTLVSQWKVRSVYHYLPAVFVQHSDTSRQHAGTRPIFLFKMPRCRPVSNWRYAVTAMSRSLSAKSLKVRRSGSDEDSIKMRVPQESREFFAGGISSVGVETGSCLAVYGNYPAHNDIRNSLIWRILGFLILEDGTLNCMYRNVGKERPLYSA